MTCLRGWLAVLCLLDNANHATGDRLGFLCRAHDRALIRQDLTPTRH